MKNKITPLQQRKQIYLKVLNKITPTKQDLNEELELFKQIEKKILATEGSHSHLEWCGSSARNTHLKGDRDLDLFVMFDKELSEKELEIEGLKLGKIVFRGHTWEKAYSQHPYIRGVINGFDVEIIPGYIVKKGSEKKSAVDRTPFHNKYLLARMDTKQKQEVRLLKQFLKGIDAYGADLKNCALPGYGVELLILKYETFENTLINITKWKSGQKIKFNTKKSKPFEEPLILIDPVDENRNVASALSQKQFDKMIFASELFLAKPNIKFFFKQKSKTWDKSKIKNMLDKKELIAIKTTFPKNILSDLVWGQLRRMLKKISRDLIQKDFVVLREELWSNEEDVWFIFELETLTLQKAKKIVGPNVEDKENTEKFLENKKKILSGPRIENGRIVVEIERSIVDAKKILANFIEEYKKKETKAMKQSLRKAQILQEKDLLREYKGEFAEFFSYYLEGKEVFE
ncbi:MAG: CCA tRNA nucleotidyltransferase [archaeon]|jgi:tRNA nucleotidyltransferase (CCA-adding enzyme)